MAMTATAMTAQMAFHGNHCLMSILKIEIARAKKTEQKKQIRTKRRTVNCQLSQNLLQVKQCFFSWLTKQFLFFWLT